LPKKESSMNQAELSAFKQFVDREGALLEGAAREDLAGALQGCDPALGEVLEYALFSGGKRIRPLLAVLAARICGRNDRELYWLAVAFEYLHVATLVHDDVIDNARQRRGRDAVGHRFGMAAAILAGDWLHARSMHLVGRYAGARGLDVFCHSTAGMVDGEFLQLRYVADPEVTEEQYFSVIHRKTALLIGSTCEIGALFGGADKRQQQSLALYGDRLGTAFQVIDDLLDYQGNSAATGKAIGNDFIEGKMTLPLIRAFAAAGREDRAVLTSLLRRERTDPAVLARFSGLVDALGGFSSARQSAEQMVGEAVSALDVFARGGDPESLAMLKTLAGYVLARDK
jgi:octaprenyl-diphosphate synthase